MARPTKFSPDVAQQIVQLVKVGNYPGVAATATGVSRATFYRWTEKGRKQKRGRFREFCDALTRAIAEAEASHVTILRLAAQGTESRHGDWRAAAHYLERRKPRRWGRRDHLNMKHDGRIEDVTPPQHKVDLTLLTDDELARYSDLMHQMLAIVGAAEERARAQGNGSPPSRPLETALLPPVDDRDEGGPSDNEVLTL